MDWQSDSQPNPSPANFGRPGANGRTFSLSTLFILVTAFSLWMGLAVTLPAVAVVGLILLLPAIVRGLAEIKVARRVGHTMTLDEKAAHLYYSILTVVLIYMVAFGTLYTLTIAGFAIVDLIGWLLHWDPFDAAYSTGRIVATVLVCIATTAFSLWLYWRWWPRKGKLPW